MREIFPDYSREMDMVCTTVPDVEISHRRELERTSSIDKFEVEHVTLIHVCFLVELLGCWRVGGRELTKKQPSYESSLTTLTGTQDDNTFAAM